MDSLTTAHPRAADFEVPEWLDEAEFYMVFQNGKRVAQNMTLPSDDWPSQQQPLRTLTQQVVAQTALELHRHGRIDLDAQVTSVSSGFPYLTDCTLRELFSLKAKCINKFTTHPQTNTRIRILFGAVIARP